MKIQGHRRLCICAALSQPGCFGCPKIGAERNNEAVLSAGTGSGTEHMALVLLAAALFLLGNTYLSSAASGRSPKLLLG